MAIEAPLRELGIHDVFQLLDLSRKTGTLRVTSELRDNEGVVYFDSGRVIHASIRSNPHPLGAILVRSGKITEGELERARALQAKRRDGKRLGEILVEMEAITARELERQVRIQIEAVVFELMSWREGFFSFEERKVEDAPAEATVRISTESLLMEGARRIDEWSRISDKVPHLGVIPVLASVDNNHPTLLDLLPHEWEVLSAIDAERNLRDIALVLGSSEFDIAKVAYGLVSTGVVELRLPDAHHNGATGPMEDPRPHLERATAALAEGHPELALQATRLAVSADPHGSEPRLVLGRVLLRLGRAEEAVEELRRALKADPQSAPVYLELGYAAARAGEFAHAVMSWERFLEMAPGTPEAARVKAALESAHRLSNLIEAHAGG